MKSRNRWTLMVAASSLALLAAACAGMRQGYSSSETAAMREAALAYLADDDLTADVPQGLAHYTEVEAGDSERLARPFAIAPPQVPHELASLLPITIEENACLACHLPDNAGKDDVPIPASHFSRPRVALALVRSTAAPHGEGMLSHVAEYTAGEDLVGARYNCVQCHTPKSQSVSVSK